MSRRVDCMAASLLLIAGFAEISRAAEILASAGAYRRYLDEPASVTYGAAVKIPVARRFSVRPEFLADSGKVYSNVLVLGSVTGDFTDPGKVATGYWIGSAGAVRTREEMFSLNAWQWALLGGAGVRFAITETWTAAAEFRAGMPAFPLVTFHVGYRWGKGRWGNQ